MEKPELKAKPTGYICVITEASEIRAVKHVSSSQLTSLDENQLRGCLISELQKHEYISICVVENWY